MHPAISSHISHRLLRHFVPPKKHTSYDYQEYMFDGAKTNFSIRVLNFFNAINRTECIKRGGSVDWPPRSPDHDPKDIFLWGYMKSLVFQSPLGTAENLVVRIVVRAHKIQATTRVHHLFFRRYQLCNDACSRHFKHLV